MQLVKIFSIQLSDGFISGRVQVTNAARYIGLDSGFYFFSSLVEAFLFFHATCSYNYVLQPQRYKA
jgi:hypothetical protein